MQIELKLNKDFERCLEEMTIKYGEDFLYLNGLHPSQLDFSEFIDKFKDTGAVADSTIDPNANARHKDIRSFITEKAKPEDKLFGLNKVFTTIKKQWGLRTAKKWFELEFSRAFYLNDSTTVSYYPYCYLGSEMITIKYRNQVSVVSFKQLYNIVNEPEEILNGKDNAFVKYPQDLYVLDLVGEKCEFTHVSRVVKHQRNNKLQYIKLSNGLDQIVTEDHQMITSNGEKASKDLVLYDDTLKTIKVDYDQYLTHNVEKLYLAEELSHLQEDLFINDMPVTEENLRSSGVVKYLKNHKLPNASKLNSCKIRQPQLNNELYLTKELGYIIGLIVTDGTYCHEIVSISQNQGKVLDRFLEACSKCNIPVIKHGAMHYTIGNTLFTELLTTLFLKKAKSEGKELLPRVFNYNREFLIGLLSGIIDGDGNVPKAWKNICGYKGNSRTLSNQFAQITLILGFKPCCQIRKYKKGWCGKLLKEPKYMYGVDFLLYKDSTPLWSVKFEQNSRELIEEKKSNKALRASYTAEYGDKEVIVLSEHEISDDVVFDITTDTHHFICNNILSHNCWANDLTRLAKEGLFFLDDYNNLPPKHLSTFFEDVIEFVSFLSNRQSGAVGLPNILIWAYYFWKRDVETGYTEHPETYLKQWFQNLIYRLNQPFLRIDQSAFTNVSIFDRVYLNSLFGGMEFPDGTFAVDYIEEIVEFQKKFMESVSEIREENMFTFPVLTFSLYFKDNKFGDEEFARWASNHNRKWSDSNFFISDNVGVLSNCCRLLSSLDDVSKNKQKEKLSTFVNSIGGSGLSIGSCRVSTINLARIAQEVLDHKEIKKIEPFKEKYLKILRDRTEIDCKTLASMRHILKRNIEKGLLPNYQEGAVELDKQFCTIGILGLYEVIDMFGLITSDEFGNKSYTEEGLEFASKILDVVNEVKDNFECDFSFNVEQIPGENTAGVLATANNLLFEDNRYFILSNQWIPLMEKCTIQEKCRLGAILDAKCGGGCISHIDIENRFPTEEEAWDMLNYVASHKCIYFAFTTKISVCEDKHAFIGTKECPVCGKPQADTFARVVGFYVPRSGYQKIRRKEFDMRKWYNVLQKDSMFT